MPMRPHFERSSSMARARFREVHIHPLVLQAFAPAIISFAPQGLSKRNAMRMQDPDRFERAMALSRENVFDVFEAWDLIGTQDARKRADEARYARINEALDRSPCDVPTCESERDANAGGHHAGERPSPDTGGG
jgi:hypothetical protein